MVVRDDRIERLAGILLVLFVEKLFFLVHVEKEGSEERRHFSNGGDDKMGLS